MHTVWKGTIRIAKIQIPVKLYAANDDQEILFKQLHKECGQSISHRKFCPTCNEAVEKDDIQRGYDLGGGNYIEITDEDLKQAESLSDRFMNLEHFVRDTDVDPIYLKKHYYVGPEQIGYPMYQLLQACLSNSRKIGIGYITLRSTTCLAAVRAMKEGIALSLLYFADEVRPIQQIMDCVRITPDACSPIAFDAINQLVTAMTVNFRHDQYKNRHHDELKRIINSKINNQTIPFANHVSKSEEKAVDNTDIVAAIQRSIEAVGFLNDSSVQEGLH